MRPATDRELLDKFPALPWNEPIAVELLPDSELERPRHKHYACRLCIAKYGLKGGDIPHLPLDRDSVVRHIKEKHGLD